VDAGHRARLAGHVDAVALLVAIVAAAEVLYMVIEGSTLDFVESTGDLFEYVGFSMFFAILVALVALGLAIGASWAAGETTRWTRPTAIVVAITAGVALLFTAGNVIVQAKRTFDDAFDTNANDIFFAFVRAGLAAATLWLALGVLAATSAPAVAPALHPPTPQWGPPPSPPSRG
jgi:hypothetical protein